MEEAPQVAPAFVVDAARTPINYNLMKVAGLFLNIIDLNG